MTAFNPNPSIAEIEATKAAMAVYAQRIDWRNPKPLSGWAFDLLQAANQANPYWMQAVLYGAYIMISRRRKHSGANHPFFNFVDIWRRRSRRTVKDVFLFLVDLKLARLTASDDDFADDSQIDGWVDAGNYIFLAVGYLLAALTPKDVIPGLGEEDKPSFREWEDIWPVICVDLDGVLNMYAGWTGQYENYAVRDGAREFLEELNAAGFHVVVCTAQPSERLMEIEAWFLENNLRDLVHMITNQKPPAVAYVDDRALRFNGTFAEVTAALKDFKAHWQKKDGKDGG